MMKKKGLFSKEKVNSVELMNTSQKDYLFKLYSESIFSFINIFRL